jgi:hypothetical protein
MLQAIRPNRTQKRVSVGKKAPAPVEGWDAITPVSAMDPKRAIVLDNWFPDTGFVTVRKGYAAHASGVGTTSTPVQSMFAYNALTAVNNKLFAVAGGEIYDCTAAATATSTGITGLSSSRWRGVNYTTSAGVEYLWICSGLDAPRHYNGSAWATPAITGVTPADIINVAVYKRYIWGVLTGSMDACYLPLDSVAGAATKYPLGSVMGLGGYLVAIGNWTRDGGSGPDDFIVFISSRGQAAVYHGTNPASDFTLVGVYNIPPPIGYNCLTKVAGDLAVVTLDGVMPLSLALQQDRGADVAIALTQRINDAMNSAAQSYSANFGWEFTPFSKVHAALLNIPVAENVTAHQYVVNTLTGAWCRFTGWNFNCFTVFNDRLYAGTNLGTVVQAWTGSVDGSADINAIGQTAYNYYDNAGINKRFTAIQPLITTDQDVTPAIGLSTDFRDNAVVSTPSAIATSSALYDSAIYDTDIYAVEGRTSADWTTVAGIGQCASLHFRAVTSVSSYITIKLNGFHVVYETGEFY